MLGLQEQFSDNPAAPLPDDPKGRSVDSKYLTRSNGNYLFTHGLIRAYLALKYLRARGPHLPSGEGVEIDDNWRPMLEFFFLKLDQPDEARQVLEVLLIKKKRLAGKLFARVGLVALHLCCVWADDFKLKFANAMLASRV